MALKSGDNSFGKFLHIHHILLIGVAFMFISVPCLCNYSKFCPRKNRQDNNYKNFDKTYFSHSNNYDEVNELDSVVDSDRNNNSFDSLLSNKGRRTSSNSFVFVKDGERNSNKSFEGSRYKNNSKGEPILF